VNAERVRRNVRWFYRTKIKHPPDSLEQLAREYHEAAHRGLTMAEENHRATVRYGIESARRLLGTVPAHVYRLAMKPSRTP
jgi:hypothetical protein